MFSEKRKGKATVARVPGFLDFSHRGDRHEIMDDPASSEASLRTTLRQFRFISRYLSRTPSLFCRYFLPDMVKAGLRRVTILDIGAGGGHFARWCVSYLKRRGITPKVICLDSDARVIKYLQTTCAAFPEIEIEHASLFELNRGNDSVDYVVSTHVLHHISDAQIPKFLDIAYSLAHRGMLIVDLERNPAAYLAFFVFSALFLHGGFIRPDGLLSIKRGFTPEYIRGYIDAAGLNGCLEIGKAAFWHIFIRGTPRCNSIQGKSSIVQSYI
jgi:2-polyprenyl-3-methyl-5-hydroxy-6-metoxy-1,4-benzoquinol methylase